MKYCRRGRPHACHVQLSPDECELEWVSGAAKPRTLRLAAVKDVIAGQTTAVFRSARNFSPPALAEFELSCALREGACQGFTSQACLSPSFIASPTAQSARWTLYARSARICRDTLGCGTESRTPGRMRSNSNSGTMACALQWRSSKACPPVQTQQVSSPLLLALHQ